MSFIPPSHDATVPAVSVIVPVRNEAGNISPLIAEIAAALDGRWDYEIVYVNDGSTDATAERLATEMSERKNLREIRHARSSGAGVRWRRAPPRCRTLPRGGRAR